MTRDTDLRWCIQCTDKNSMTVGSYVYHKLAPMQAVSPVFTDLIGLFTWMKQQGYTTSYAVDDLMVRELIKERVEP